MIRFKLREQIAEKVFRENRAVTISEIAEQTGIARGVLSAIANQRGYNTVTDNLDRLCVYFGCRLEDLAEHVKGPTDDRPDDSGTQKSRSHSSTGKKRVASRPGSDPNSKVSKSAGRWQ